ncbi:LLM class flavin-dependent oxidoreductase [Nostoc sp. FACHB-87]|uniref:LLM class flavin-dependent oxidoreductase n=1 Tax=Nostocaceae TaxID=1162 RepID=UPI001683DF29|nr:MULTISPECIES: LLM class flavin-dependent oxidoreductase [Nostocaceae]MBD2457801.1 LLM class flavin-dependent oxidoreductase [Nostoc sp. FACHB-87]MBD2479026.1 LLM class flavin-dependent oxidoreductase [Anabaena sp. FACHB-83]
MPLQFGIWSPVCGGWLRVVNHEANVSTQDLVKLAVEADKLGYDFYYIPEHYLNAIHGPKYHVADGWITAALASLNTKNIKIVAAVQPGFKLPAVVANVSANIQNQLSNGRFALSGIAGWWKLEVESYGDVWLPHSERYARLEEYIDVIKGLWTVDDFNYVGKYYTIENGIITDKPTPKPPIFIAGESDRAINLAARHGDYLFINADEPEKTAALVQKVKKLAIARYGRNIRVAMSAFAIVREHTAEAEARLAAIYRSADQQQIKYFQEQIDPNVVAHNKLDISQTIEANLGLSAQLVGDRYTIIQRLKEYETVGVDLIILKFESMLEDTIRFHKLVISEYKQQNNLVRL